MSAIELTSLTKRYGARRGIEAISLDVPEGVLFGFIGPNGAGKTTTIRILLGLMRPSEGRARIFGRDVVDGGAAARDGVAYVPGEINLYPAMRAGDVLDYLGRFVPGDHRRRRAELIDALDIDTGARAADLSLGNRKKVAIAAALQHRPRLIILDEPSNGLDPLMQDRLHGLLREEVAAGATVFFSSHVLAEVQSVCKTVAVLREGRLLAVDDVATLRGRALRRVEATFDRGAPEVQAALAALPGAQAFELDGATVRFLYDGPAPALLAALAAAAPTDVRIEEPSLDEIFRRYYRGGAGGGAGGGDGDVA
jgi:ABC-2 type transport system ATP-binding protein